jgi:hypothetical protein
MIDLPETPSAAKASPQFLRPGIVHRLDKGTSGVLIAVSFSPALALLFPLRILCTCKYTPGQDAGRSRTPVEALRRATRAQDLPGGVRGSSRPDDHCRAHRTILAQ